MNKQEIDNWFDIVRSALWIADNNDKNREQPNYMEAIDDLYRIKEMLNISEGP